MPGTAPTSKRIHPQPPQSRAHDDTEFFRLCLMDMISDLGHSGLQRFLHDLFAQDAVVQSYGRPLLRNKSHVPSPTRREYLWPFEVALTAARRAECMLLVRPHERALAFAATLAYPSALFYQCQEPGTFTAPWNPGAERDLLRQSLLDSALRRLRQSDPGLQACLSAVLGLGTHEDCDPDQVARLQSTLGLALLRCTAPWHQSLCDSSNAQDPTL
jgi:hypothetical protein